MSALLINFCVISTPSGCFKLILMDFLPAFKKLESSIIALFYKTNKNSLSNIKLSTSA